MKLYNAETGNTKRVRIFIAEKGIKIPITEIGIPLDTRSEEFRKINSLGEVPVLELDNGQIITESLAICRYLEAQFPNPPLMGTTPQEQGHIEMWSQRIYGQIFMTYGMFARHTMPLFADVVDQVPAFAEMQKKAMPEKWAWLNSEMSDGRPFIAGDTFTMADVHGMTTLMLADIFGPVPDDCAHVGVWMETVRERPSWQA